MREKEIVQNNVGGGRTAAEPACRALASREHRGTTLGLTGAPGPVGDRRRKKERKKERKRERKREREKEKKREREKERTASECESVDGARQGQHQCEGDTGGVSAVRWAVRGRGARWRG